jgi:hypothetical protein
MVARHEQPTQTPENPAGKGRPTPKRSEAERGRRRPVAAPATGREAARLRRIEATERRTQLRHALATGDEAGLPARDKGPVRRYVREVVDARLGLSEFFIPIAVPLYVVTLVGQRSSAAGIAMLAMLLVTAFVIVELAIFGFQLRRKLGRKFAGQNTKGAVFYGVMRGTQPRRMRAPRPQVKRFQTID